MAIAVDAQREMIAARGADRDMGDATRIARNILPIAREVERAGLRRSHCKQTEEYETAPMDYVLHRSALCTGSGRKENGGSNLEPPSHKRVRLLRKPVLH